MIRVRKPAEAPSALSGKGVEETSELCRRYGSGEREFSFKKHVYAHAEVKDALIAAQFKKCCFCEQVVSWDGDVEHFRPKSGLHGYYWLAYEWTNLFLACGPCNSRHKRNLFPLADEACRARCHDDDLSIEQPLFLNPAEDDPIEWIGWHEEVAFALKDNRRGRETILALNLNRRHLLESRRERLSHFRALIDCLRCAHEKNATELASRLQTMIDEMTDEQAAYSAMIRFGLSAG